MLPYRNNVTIGAGDSTREKRWKKRDSRDSRDSRNSLAKSKKTMIGSLARRDMIGLNGVAREMASGLK